MSKLEGLRFNNNNNNNNNVIYNVPNPYNPNNIINMPVRLLLESGAL